MTSDIGLLLLVVHRLLDVVVAGFAVRNFDGRYVFLIFSTMITNFDKLCSDLEKQELEVCRLRRILTYVFDVIIGYLSNYYGYK